VYTLGIGVLGVWWVKVGEGSGQGVIEKVRGNKRMLVRCKCWCRFGYGKWDLHIVIHEDEKVESLVMVVGR